VETGHPRSSLAKRHRCTAAQQQIGMSGDKESVFERIDRASPLVPLFLSRLDVGITLAAKLLLGLLVIALVVNFFVEIYRPVYQIAPFHIPKDFASADLSSESVRDEYVYELSKIVAESNAECPLYLYVRRAPASFMHTSRSIFPAPTLGTCC
jgi:hypothetical protein